MRTFPIPRSFPGRLAVATRPRGDDWLDTDVSQLKRDGWRVLVSALERSEQGDLGLAQERAVAEAHGLFFLEFPIPDRGTPDVAKTIVLVREIARYLVSGSSVAVHCRMGIGRSSLICAATMVALGERPEAAWPTLADARGVPVPDTEDQRRWLDAFVRGLKRD